MQIVTLVTAEKNCFQESFRAIKTVWGFTVIHLSKQKPLHSEGWNASLATACETVPAGNWLVATAALFRCAAVRRCCPSSAVLALPPVLLNGAVTPWWSDWVGG